MNLKRREKKFSNKNKCIQKNIKKNICKQLIYIIKNNIIRRNIKKKS